MADSVDNETDAKPTAIDPERLFWSSFSVSGSLYRWILASLVTLNGGAIVALADWNEPANLPGAGLSVLLWGVGCLCAVAGGMLSALFFAMLGLSAKKGKIRFGSGEADVDFRPMAWALVLSAVSLVAFLAGLAIAAYPLVHPT